MSPTGTIKAANNTFIWQFDHIKKHGQYFESPYFTVGGAIAEHKITWKLILISVCEDYFGIQLVASFMNDESQCDVLHKSYLWNNGASCHLDKTAFSLTKFSKGNSTSEMSLFALPSTTSPIRVACCMTSPNYAPEPNVEMNRIAGLSRFFLSERMSDVTIEVDDMKLSAHTIILSAASEVFAAMMTHDMLEGNGRVIHIVDISYEAMKEILRYIYCGEVENFNTHGIELLAAAEKYSLFTLKAMCAEALLKNLNLSNVCEVLTVSHLYSCYDLKEASVDFIINNLPAIIDTEDFKKVKEAYLMDILCKIAQKNG